MRFYPINSGFFEHESDLFYNNNGTKGLPAFYGAFGAIHVKHLQSAYSIDHVCFDLKQPTLLFYKLSDVHSLIILAIDFISFELGQNVYNIQPGNAVHISGYKFPQFFLFPVGRYQFYTIAGTGLETDLEICRLEHYDKIRDEIDLRIDRKSK
jgi:hypothetical protein